MESRRFKSRVDLVESSGGWDSGLGFSGFRVQGFSFRWVQNKRPSTSLLNGHLNLGVPSAGRRTTSLAPTRDPFHDAVRDPIYLAIATRACAVHSHEIRCLRGGI